mmetsp:Transcript_7125/g.14787  ORF Transcript_7125/g.14787 Transcript_7125/m.14787 type:complete len:1189 (-) Transcript_7125:3343-6909(-)
MTSPEPALAGKLEEPPDRQQRQHETQWQQRRDEEQTRPSASPSLEDSDSDPGKYLLFHRSDDDDDNDDGARAAGSGGAGAGAGSEPAAPENHHVIPKSPDQRRPPRASVSLRGTSRRNVVPPVFLPYRVGGPPIASTTRAPLTRMAEPERDLDGETDFADLDLSAAVGVSTSYSYDNPGADGAAVEAGTDADAASRHGHNNVITPASARTRTRADSASPPIPPKYMYPPSSPIEAAAKDLEGGPDATPSPVHPARSSPSSSSSASSPGGSDSWREWIPPQNRNLQKPGCGRNVSDAASRDVVLEPRHRDIDAGGAAAGGAADGGTADGAAACGTARGMEAARIQPQFVRTKPSKDKHPPRSQRVVPPSLVVDSSRSNDSADGPKAINHNAATRSATATAGDRGPGRIQVVGGGTQTNPPPWASPYYVSHSRSAESNASEEWDPPRNPANPPLPPASSRYSHPSTSTTPLPFATPDREAPVPIPPSGYPPVDPSRYDTRYPERGGAVPNYPPPPPPSRALSRYDYPPLETTNPSSSHPPPYGSGNVTGPPPPPPGYAPASAHPPPSYPPERYPPDRAPPIPSTPTTPSSYPHHPPPPPPHGNPYYAYPPPYAHPPAIYGGTPHRPSSSHVTPPNEPNNRTGDVDEQDNVTRIHPLLKDYNPHFDGIALRPQFRIIGRNKGKKSKDSFTEGGGDETKESAANDDAGNGATATRKRRRRRKPTEKAAAAAAMAAAAAAAAAAAKERKERLARLRAAKESADVVDEDRSADPDPDKDDGQSTRTERDRTQRSERDHDQDKPEEDDDDHREEEEEEEELKNLDPGSDEDIPASKRAAMASAAALRAAASGSPLRPPKAASEVEFDIADPPLEPIHPPSEEAVLESAMEMTENDVLCGRGGGTNSQMGNRRFRALVRDFQPTYLMARRREKPLMARSIVLIVRKRGGRFLRRDEEKGQLFEVGDEKAEAKTSQALREGLDVRATKTAANTLLGTDGSKRRKRLPVPNEDGTEPKIDMPLANMEPIQVDTAGARRVSKQEEEATPGIGQPVLHPAPQADCRAPPMPPHRYPSEPYYGRPDYGPPPPHPGGYGHHPSYSYYLPPPPPPRLGSDPYYPSYDYGPPTPIRSHHVPYPPPPSYSYPPHPSSSTPGMHPSYSYTSPAMSYDSQFSPPRNEGRKRQNPNPLTPVHSRVNHL